MSGDELNELRSDIREIKTALIGNDLGNEGLVKKVERHEKRLSVLERYVLMGMGGAFALGIIYNIAKDFIHKI